MICVRTRNRIDVTGIIKLSTEENTETPNALVVFFKQVRHIYLPGLLEIIRPIALSFMHSYVPSQQRSPPPYPSNLFVHSYRAVEISLPLLSTLRHQQSFPDSY